MTLGLALAASWGASAAQAQTADSRDSRSWTLEGLRAGYCVRFLADPKLASRELRAGHLLLDAAKDPRLHPALQQIVTNQPEFGSWTPSSLCFYYMDAVKLGRRRVVEPDRRYQLLGVWTLATTLHDGGARRDLVVDMYASRNSLLRAAQTAEVRIHEAHSVVSDKADTTFDMYSIKIGKTLLVWSGRHTGDSTRVDQTIQEDWSVSGLRSSIRAARLEFQPAWSWPLIGSLRVEGKGDLAETLRSSPIRFVGPLYRGGGGHLRFFR